MEGRPRTSTFSFSLPFMCSLILNEMVIFMFLKLKSLVKGLKFKIALFNIDVKHCFNITKINIKHYFNITKINIKHYFNIACIELKYLPSILSCDIKILYYDILLFLNL